MNDQQLLHEADTLLKLRPAQPDDQSFLQQLFEDVRAPEFLALGLPPLVLRQLLSVQRHAQASSYVAQHPQAQEYIVLVDGERGGRLLVNRYGEPTVPMYIVDIALLSRFRGRGLGTALLHGLAAEADGAGRALRLTVRRNNPALRLYERLGFVPVTDDALDIRMERRGSLPVPLTTISLLET